MRIPRIATWKTAMTAGLTAAVGLGLSTGAAFARPAAAKSKINLTFLTFDVGKSIPEVGMVKAFNKLHPNIHVHLQMSSSAYYYSKLLTELATGTGPDVFFVGDTELRMFVHAGVVQNLTPLFRHHTYGLNATKYFPKVLNVGKFNGKIYFIPKDWNVEAVIYNVKLFQEAHLPLPKAGWTWAQFIRDAKALTVVKNGHVVQWGSILPGNWLRAGFELFEPTFGASPLSPNGQTASGYLNSPQSIRAITYYLDMYRVDHISMTPSQETGFGSADPFEMGKVGMEIGGSWPLATYYKDPHLKFGVAPDPLLTPKSKVVSTVFWAGAAVNKRSPHLKAAEELAAFLSSSTWQWGDSKWAMDAEKGPWIAATEKRLPLQRVFFQQASAITPLEPKLTFNWLKDVSPALSNMIQEGILKPKSSIPALVKTATQQIDQALAKTYGK